VCTSERESKRVEVLFIASIQIGENRNKYKIQDTRHLIIHTRYNLYNVQSVSYGSPVQLCHPIARRLTAESNSSRPKLVISMLSSAPSLSSPCPSTLVLSLPVPVPLPTLQTPNKSAIQALKLLTMPAVLRRSLMRGMSGGG